MLVWDNVRLNLTAGMKQFIAAKPSGSVCTAAAALGSRYNLRQATGLRPTRRLVAFTGPQKSVAAARIAVEVLATLIAHALPEQTHPVSAAQPRRAHSGGSDGPAVRLRCL
ncbi:hypothetical protein GCM10010423_29580 [Streptomyces levis]|uniref:Transposase n=1 Tax=Streptomyces levis TaxID=285566 RepID=A0ABN3NSB1_9ACTN